MIKNAHNKYVLQFLAWGAYPSKEDLKELLNAIHAGIKSGELTKATCDAELVERMQWVIISTLTDGIRKFSFYRDYPPVLPKFGKTEKQVITIPMV